MAGHATAASSVDAVHFFVLTGCRSMFVVKAKYELSLMVPTGVDTEVVEPTEASPSQCGGSLL